MSSDPGSPVVLTSVPTDIEARAIVTALASLEIRAETTGGFIAGFRAEAPGDVNVVVRKEDFDRARLALEQIRRDPNVDWTEIDVGKREE